MTSYTPEQRDRASIDALLADFELKQEQLRQLPVYEPRRLTFQLLTAVATRLRDEKILLYPYAFLLVVQPDGSFEVSRVD